MTFEVLDIIALVILIIAALRAMFKGFVKEFMSKAGLLIGFLLALMFSPSIAPYIDEQFGFGSWSNIAAFAALFLAGYLVTKVVANALRTILEGLHLAFLDNILGFVFGLIEGAIIISFLVYLLRLQTVFEIESFLSQSWVVEQLEFIAPYSVKLFEENL
ncbi:MAG: CvpA family protein [Spirochaetales bacterium]|nr:CvpA family protein [Spirochaetales bacterium]